MAERSVYKKKEFPAAPVIDLKPNEKVIIGSAVITNDKQRTRYPLM